MIAGAIGHATERFATDKYWVYRRIFDGLRIVAIILALIIFLFPFYWVIKTSFEPTRLIYDATVLIPRGFTIAHYIEVVNVGFLGAVWNSLVVAIGATILTIVASLLGAYSILRYEYRGRGQTAKLVLLTYMFPHIALIVPVFFVVSQIGLLSHPLPLIFIHSMLALPFCIWILQAFLMEVPRELEEAARIEGATAIGAFLRITVPLSWPGIVAAGTFAFIMSWGEYMFAFILMRSRGAHTVPVAIHALLGSYAIDWGLLAATSVVATLPVLAIFWLMAKYLGRGIAKGTGLT